MPKQNSKVQKTAKKEQEGKKRSRLPLLFVISLLMAAAALFIPPLFKHAQNFNETFFTKGISSFLSGMLGFLSSKITASVTEAVIMLLLVLLAVGITVFILRLIKGNFKAKRLATVLCTVLFTVAILLNLFNLEYGMNYYNLPLYKKLSLNISQYTDTHLYGMCISLRSSACSLRQSVEVNEKGIFHVKDTDKLLKEIAQSVAEIKEINPKNRKVYPAKQVYASKVMSLLGISGMYVPFFGEANVNTDQPSLLLFSSAAHENAHSLGIAREDEANFAAYLACISSNNVNIQYSGVMLALIYAQSALYKADASLYKELINGYSEGLIADINDYNLYWHQNDGLLNKISSGINDAYLKHNGTKNGTQSYNDMVNYLLAYYEKQNAQNK